MLRPPLCVALFFCALTTAPAATLSGQFEFTGATIYSGFSIPGMSGTTTFTYDTEANVGTLHDFYWIGGTLRDFQFAVFPTVYNGFTPISSQVNPADWAMVTDFADLTDFGLRTRIRTGLGGGQTEEYYRRWVLLDSQVSPGEHLRGADWSYRGTSLFNPPVAFGTASNFVPTPEPGTAALLGLGCALAAGRRPRRR